MITAFAIIAFSALIHASFQLSVSMLTLLSGHAIGSKTSHAKLIRLTNSFTLGVSLMTLLLLSFSALIFNLVFQAAIPAIAWVASCGLLIGLGIAVWIFYYRKEQGTSLWIPRGMARYLTDRTKSTKQSAEAFSLGMTSVLAELIFIIAPLVVAALVLINLPPTLQLAGIAVYALISLIPLIAVNGLIGSGHKLSHIQKWREHNKKFLQFAAGSGLVVLGVFLYVDRVVSLSAFTQGMY